MSEFRQDPVSGDWVIIAPGRAKRPSELSPKRPPRAPAPKVTCPFEFENLMKDSQWPPLFRIPETAAADSTSDIKKLRMIIVRNKYPIVSPVTTCESFDEETLYHAKRGGGIHNLLITRDHFKNFADVNPALAQEILETIQRQYRAMRGQACSKYVSAFFNWGQLSGASVWHPHYQILSLPVQPPHVVRSLRGAEAYFKKNKRCVRCDILKEELARKGRIVAVNRTAVAFTRFASKSPFEVNVIPRRHYTFFEETPTAVIRDVAALMQLVMRRFKKQLNDPDLNFFIHSAPIDGKPYPHHHWHVELVPKLTTAAGLEFSTEIYANVEDPDEAARILRK